MSNLRISLAPSPVDRQIQQAVSRATREIEAALSLALQAPGSRSQRRRTITDLQRLLHDAQGVAYIGPVKTPDEPVQKQPPVQQVVPVPPVQEDTFMDEEDVDE